MKKNVVWALVLLIVFSFAGTVSAASDVNAYEQQVLDRLAEGVKVGDATVSASAEEINVAKNFFMRDDVNFTQDDAQVIIAGIDEVAGVIKAEGATDITDLSTSGKQQILGFAQAAAEGVTSMDITFSYDSGTKTASILSGTGSVLAQSDVTTESTVVKQTGFGYEVTAMVVGGLVVLALAGMILAKKNGLFAGNAA